VTSWSVSVAPARKVRLSWQYGERDGQSQAEGRNYGGKTFDPKIDASDNLSAVAGAIACADVEVSGIFKIPPNRASLDAKTQPRNPLQVTDSL
jgi:hypothetical protein